MTYQACIKWVDIDSCSYSNTDSSTNITSSCSEIIEPHRVGHCLCHNGELSIWKRCDHEPMTCNDICTRATIGCKDPSTQFAVRYSDKDDTNLVVGCDGKWDEPGLDSASETLCDHENGYGICSDLDQVRGLELGLFDCSHLAEPNTIYIADIGSDTLLFGCGNEKSFDQIPVTPNDHKVWPFRLALDADKLRNPHRPHHLDDSWKLDMDFFANEKTIRGAVYKVKHAGGGVLCCNKLGNGSFDSVDEALQTLLEIMTFLMMFVMLSLCFVKMIKQRDSIPCCCGPLRQLIDRVIALCRGSRIPITRKRLRLWKKKRDIRRIKCQKFEEYDNKLSGDADFITDGSAHCVICLEEYQAESMVIFLKCKHSFHRDCGLPWLKEHETCPICRQYFKTAQDRHVYPMRVSLSKAGKTRSTSGTYRSASGRNRSVSSKAPTGSIKNRSFSASIKHRMFSRSSKTKDP